MKYLLCLVALLLLCLSPNPSFGQPNSSEAQDYRFIKENPHIVEELIGKIEELNKKAETPEASIEKMLERLADVFNLLRALAEIIPYSSLDILGLNRLKPDQVEFIKLYKKWPYENYIEILGTFEDLYLKSPRKEALLSKVKDYIKGLIEKNPHIVEELIRKIEKLNKEFVRVSAIRKRINALSLIITYSSLEHIIVGVGRSDQDISVGLDRLDYDILGLDRLKPDQVEFMKRAIESTMERAMEFEDKNNKTALNPPGKSRKSPKSQARRRGLSRFEGKSRSSPKSRKSRSSKRTSLLQ